MRIICGPASPTEDVSIWFFYEYLQIAFPNNVLFASSTMNAAKVYSLREVQVKNSLAFKGTCTETGRCEQSCF